MKPIELVLSKLPSAKRNGRGWKALCPAHDDRNPSLSLNEGDDGRALLHCHAGCTTDAIVERVGLTLRDLMPPDTLTPDRTPAGKPKHRVSSVTLPADGPMIYPTGMAAIGALEATHGPRSSHWLYRTAEGEPVGAVVRWDLPDGDKNIRPVARTDEGWIVGGMPTPRPLYRLPELVDAVRVFITEGEKAAEALCKLGLSATTSPHGSQCAHQADWSPLAGKECVILPDNDEAGAQYQEAVVAALSMLSPVPVMKVVELPAIPVGGDAVEYIAARRCAGLNDAEIRIELERMAEATSPVEPSRQAGLLRRYRPFPMDTLPEPLRSFIAEGAKAMGCDTAYIGLPLLSALGSAVGNSRRIQLKRGWAEPAIIWTAIVGESGTLKTPAFKLVTRRIHALQTKRFKEYEQECDKYEQDLLGYEAEFAAWKKKAIKDKASAGKPPEKPVIPAMVRYIVGDTTVEALVPILQANPRGVLLARDEIAGWIGSFDQYRGGRGGADVAHWLSMHVGETIIVDRKTGPTRTMLVPSATVSVTGGIQPGVLNRSIGKEHRESGLLARILLAYPPRRAKKWSEAEIPTSVQAALDAVFDRLYELQSEADDIVDPTVQIVHLGPEAKRAWVLFVNDHAKGQIEHRGDLASAWSKLEAYTARFALVIHLVRWAAGDPTLEDAFTVDAVSLGAAATLTRWFCDETERVYGCLTESDEDRETRELVELMERKAGSITPRELMRSSSRFTTAQEAIAALDDLVEQDMGRWEHPKPGRKGGQPSKRFVLHSIADAIDDTPDNNASDGGNVGVDDVNTTENELSSEADDGEWGEI